MKRPSAVVLRSVVLIFVAAAVFYTLNQLSDSEASSFTATSGIELSDNTANTGNPDYTTGLFVPVGDSNFAGSGAAFIQFIPVGWCVATHDNDCSSTSGTGAAGDPIPSGPPVPTGARVGTNTAQTKLALQTVSESFNETCDGSFAVIFELFEAEPDDRNGTISTTGTSNIFAPLAADADSDGILNNADLWPTYNSTLFDPDGAGAAPTVFPRARYSGHTVVSTTDVILQFLVFDPGALTAFPGQPWQSFTAKLGYPVVTVLQDPGTSNNGSIADFCSELDSDLTILGTTIDNPATASTAEAGFELHLNGSATSGLGGTGTHLFTVNVQSGREDDTDTYENALDTCPSTNNTDGDPRTNNGLDDDGLDAACDPDSTAETGHNVDQDGDGWANRLDNCPLVANANNDDEDVAVGTAVSDGGPNNDSIGDACDGSPNVPNGHFHELIIKDFGCNGAADTDLDGWCDSREDAGGTGSGENKACANDTTPDNETLDGIPVDFDDNRVVNIVDRARMVATILGGGDPARFDLDGNGFVNIGDRAAVVASIGFTC